MTSAFKINLTPGSKESLEWLGKMKNAQNEDVFLSKFVLLVDYKWNQVKNWIYAETALYLFFYGFVTIDQVLFAKSIETKYIGLILNVFMMAYEFFRIYI